MLGRDLCSDPASELSQFGGRGNKYQFHYISSLRAKPKHANTVAILPLQLVLQSIRLSSDIELKQITSHGKGENIQVLRGRNSWSRLTLPSSKPLNVNPRDDEVNILRRDPFNDPVLDTTSF
ncbi:hypothetical protein VNO77_15997 [Canavalia gladiata]|uniref:Uncharacterized protein n=1 Tax=Canavalia gladiata TaxID=3824 RepID=A0AAN9QW72_CANGL